MTALETLLAIEEIKVLRSVSERTPQKTMEQ